MSGEGRKESCLLYGAVELQSTGNMINLITSTMEEIAAALEHGHETSQGLVKQYISYIEKDILQGMRLHAVLELGPRDKLLKAAQKLDDQRLSGALLSPLHGVPILLKDAISTHPNLGMESTGGTNALMGSKVSSNAALVDKLIAGGVIILGKANMSVLHGQYGISTPPGWSPRGGQTKSAYGPDLPCGGSSTGCAVGLAAGFCAASIGVETDGSITSPARLAGLYALKPATGLVSNEGIFTLSLRQDSAGPMGKSAWDVAALLTQMTYNGIDYTACLEEDCSGSIGIMRDPLRHMDTEGEEAFGAAVKILGSLVKQDPVKIPQVERLFADMGTVGWEDGKWVGSDIDLLLVVEQYEAINKYLEGLSDCPIKNVEDLVAWNTAHPDLAFHGSEQANSQKWLELAVESKGHKDRAYKDALQRIQEASNDVEKVLIDNQVEVLVGFVRTGEGGCFASIAGGGGLPIATVPVGILKSGEPYGIVMLARRGEEVALLQVMRKCEQLVHPRPRPPMMQNCH